MRVIKLEVLVLDFDNLGVEGVKAAIEYTNYPNHCISPSVMAVESKDIGEWTDDNPLNNSKTAAAEYRRLFDT